MRSISWDVVDNNGEVTELDTPMTDVAAMTTKNGMIVNAMRSPHVPVDIDVFERVLFQQTVELHNK